MVETALDEELANHLGHDEHAPRAAIGVTRARALGENGAHDTVGEIEVEVPRDRDGSFEPLLVKKHQRRLTRVDEIVLSLYANGLTTGRN